MTALTKTQVVLEQVNDDPDDTTMLFCGEDTPNTVIIGRDVWEDMGEPEKITVTIEPGDLLND